MTAKNHYKPSDLEENDPGVLEDLKSQVQFQLEQFNKNRIKFTNEVNIYEKFITNFSKKCVEKTTKLRSAQNLDDPSISRRNKKSKEEIE